MPSSVNHLICTQVQNRSLWRLLWLPMHLITALMLMALYSGAGLAKTQANPQASPPHCSESPVDNGTFDLRCLHHRKQVHLTGQWLLKFDALGSDYQFQGPAEVPGTWRELPNNHQENPKGQGRYQLTFKGEAPAKALTLYIPRMWGARHVSLINPDGEKISLLHVGKLDDSNNPKTTPVSRQLLPLPELTNNSRLIIELGTYDTIYSGLWQAPQLGWTAQMLRADTLKKALAAAIATTLLLFAALNLALWRVKFRSNAMMVLPIAAICLAIRQVNDSDLSLELFPTMTASFDASISWLSYLIGIATGYYYIFQRFRPSIPLWIALPPIALSIAGICLVLFSDNISVQQFGVYQRPIAVFFALIMFVLLVMRNSFKSLDNRLTLIGISLIIAALGVDIAHYHLYSSGFLVPLNSLAWIFFIGSQIYLLSWRYFVIVRKNLRLNEELSELNLNLEARIQKRTEQLKEKNQELEQLYKTDALTGLANRRALAEFAEQEFARLRRYEGQIAVALVDIDFFKQVNDQYGHQAGDQTLKAIADLLRQSIREVDMASRWGGEEFCILLPGIDQLSAYQIMERIRHKVESLCITTNEHQCIQVTISSGIAAADETGNLEKLIAQADKALYQAKSQGRNRTQCKNLEQLAVT